MLEEETRWKILNENLKTELEKMEARESEERRLLQLAKDEQSVLEGELKTATMNYTSLEKNAKEKDDEISQLQAKLDKLKKEMDFANNVIQLKESDVKEANALLEEAENGRMQEKVEQMENDFSSKLSDSSTQYASLNDKLEALKKEILEKEDENNRLKVEINEKENEMMELASKYDNDRTQYKNKETELLVEISKWKRR